ncbi:Predicted arabinose efflux permease, MFS family [Streptomyces sp. Ag82_O1-12]|uniref:MFS transporter n=1 Tax=unclassified Streptomyces TaxID=2593676 RepID=UPI000BCAC646|nr:MULTISPECIES: MFS transporter [unclassified Streptomyces]SMQ18989.1 Predicted arabinose efflux permease, MFS family [Streptomyces sp. Ag82_O1-12]SOD48030.1 Predicted arabinose efflux permease, MFS family [Streptomyces sp. Ag82_G6-1]
MSTSLARPSYAAVLRLPHARRTFLAALVGRMSYGTVSIALMLSLTRASGSYAVAGSVMALFGAAGVLLSPYRAALVDRHGSRRALLPLALLYAGLLCALAVVCLRPGVSPAVLAVTAAAAGACQPPLGPTMRTVWAELTVDRQLLQRAYSLDAVAEELLYVTGPLAVGVVVGLASPAAGVLLSAGLMAAGTLAFVTSPAVASVRPLPGRTPRRTRGVSVLSRALLRPVVVIAGVGLALSAVELLVVAYAAQRHHGDETVAWVLAALAAGSAVGGLLNGAVAWRAPARVRLPLLAAGLGVTLAAAGLAPGIGTLTVAVTCAGLFIAPALTTAYLIADETAAPGTRTQAGAWINTAVNAGAAAGAAAVGLLVERLPLAACFAVAGAVALVGAVACGAGQGD